MTKLHIVAGTTGHKTAHLNQKGSMARNITASEYKEVLEQTLLPEGRSAQRDYTRGASPNGQQAGPLWVPPPTKRVRKERVSSSETRPPPLRLPPCPSAALCTIQYPSGVIQGNFKLARAHTHSGRKVK